jgi:hypothetical protein
MLKISNLMGASCFLEEMGSSSIEFGVVGQVKMDVILGRLSFGSWKVKDL